MCARLTGSTCYGHMQHRALGAVWFGYRVKIRDVMCGFPLCFSLLPHSDWSVGKSAAAGAPLLCTCSLRLMSPWWAWHKCDGHFDCSGLKTQQSRWSEGCLLEGRQFLSHPLPSAGWSVWVGDIWSGRGAARPQHHPSLRADGPRMAPWQCVVTGLCFSNGSETD